MWSMYAALGRFVGWGALSITHGVNELRAPSAAKDFVVGYVVLGISFLLEAKWFLRSTRQARKEAAMHRDLIEHVLATSDPTLRTMFAEDSAALIGLLLAAAGLGTHQLTGSSTPDAVGSILIGLLLIAVAGSLINRPAVSRRGAGRSASAGHRRKSAIGRAGDCAGDLPSARVCRAAHGLGHRQRRSLW